MNIPIMSTQVKIDIMKDSVSVINKLCALPSLDDNQKQRIYVNIKHLELMLEKDDIKNDTSDKSIFVSAINDGKAKIA